MNARNAAADPCQGQRAGSEMRKGFDSQTNNPEKPLGQSSSAGGDDEVARLLATAPSCTWVWLPLSAPCRPGIARPWARKTMRINGRHNDEIAAAALDAVAKEDDAEAFCDSADAPGIKAAVKQGSQVLALAHENAAVKQALGLLASLLRWPETLAVVVRLGGATVF